MTHAQDCNTDAPTLTLQMDTTVVGTLNVGGMDVHSDFMSTLAAQSTAWTLTNLVRLESTYGPRFVPSLHVKNWFTHKAYSNRPVTGFTLHRDFGKFYHVIACLTTDSDPANAAAAQNSGSPAHCDGIGIHLDGTTNSGHKWGCSTSNAWTTVATDGAATAARVAGGSGAGSGEDSGPNFQNSNPLIVTKY